MRRPREVPIGDTFGEWAVLGFSHYGTAKKPKPYWLCQCSCGTVKPVQVRKLSEGRSKRCLGCGGQYRDNAGKDLYLIRCEEFYKIGSSQNAKNRRSNLQTGNPYTLELLEVWEGKGELEEAAHEIMNDHHHKGEWFYVEGSEESLAKVRELLKD